MRICLIAALLLLIVPSAALATDPSPPVTYSSGTVTHYEQYGGYYKPDDFGTSAYVIWDTWEFSDGGIMTQVKYIGPKLIDTSESIVDPVPGAHPGPYPYVWSQYDYLFTAPLLSIRFEGEYDGMHWSEGTTYIYPEYPSTEDPIVDVSYWPNFVLVITGTLFGNQPVVTTY